eukprot:1143575-Pelagomonas_calceolata.AAC.1
MLQDARKSLENEIQKLTDAYCKRVDELCKTKSDELMKQANKLAGKVPMRLFENGPPNLNVKRSCQPTSPLIKDMECGAANKWMEFELSRQLAKKKSTYVASSHLHAQDFEVMKHIIGYRGIFKDRIGLHSCTRLQGATRGWPTARESG